MQEHTITSNKSTSDPNTVGYHTAVKELLTLLETGDEAQRCYSAQAIAYAKIYDAEPQLNACLYHSDPDVVIDALKALHSIVSGDITALQDVARHHPESDARISALHTLANHKNAGNDSEIQTLLEEIAQGRQHQDEWGKSSDWDDWWDLQLTAVQLLANHYPNHCDTLFETLLQDDPEPELESALYYALAKTHPQTLVKRLNKARLITQRKLLRAIATNQDKIATIALFKQLNHSDPELRKIAIKGLCQRNATEYNWDIARCLCDENPYVQQTAQQGLKQLNTQLETKQLLSLTKQAPESALPALLKLLQQQAYPINNEFLIWLNTKLASPNSDVVIAVIELINQQSITDPLQNSEQTHSLVEAILNHVQRGTLATHTRAEFIRLLTLFERHYALFAPVLRHLLQGEHNEQQTDPTLRQAILEVLTNTNNPKAQQWLKEILLGMAAYPETLEVAQVCDPDNNQNPDTLASQQSEEEAESNTKEQTLDAILAAHGDKFSDLPSNEGVISHSPNSTLAAIQQTNVEAMLNQPTEATSQEQTILEMVDELEPEYDPYTKIVRDHFDTSDKLALNRRKIAKLPQYSNKQLAIRALGQATNNHQAGELLIEALLGATPTEQYDLFHSLARLAKHHPDPIFHNAIGAAGNVLHHSDKLTKQAAANYLAYMPSSKALPLLLLGARDEDEHVRICSLTSLAHILENSSLRKQYEEHTHQVLLLCLNDTAGGVRKLGFQILAKLDLGQYLEPLLTLAIDDEESNAIAAPCLLAQKNRALTILANQLPHLDDHRQPLAIRLMGQLMVTHG